MTTAIGFREAQARGMVREEVVANDPGKNAQTFLPGPTPNTVQAVDGSVLTVPDGWALLSPGDAGLTRRVKAAGDHFVVQEKVGRRTFSRGLWAPATTIDRIRAELESERSTVGYVRRQEAASRRRAQAQERYVEDFHGAVVKFLGFHADHAGLADRLARAVTEHATPVGSGTVARTERIPIEQRAEAAVVAWMRHQTTGYDGMTIPRGKGKRREVRRMLARRCQELFQRYRRGESVGDECPLKRTLADGVQSGKMDRGADEDDRRSTRSSSESTGLLLRQPEHD